MQNVKQILALLSIAKRWNGFHAFWESWQLIFLLLNNIPVHDYATVYPLAHWGHVSFFHDLEIITKTTSNICVQVFVRSLCQSDFHYCNQCQNQPINKNRLLSFVSRFHSVIPWPCCLLLMLSIRVGKVRKTKSLTTWPGRKCKEESSF